MMLKKLSIKNYILIDEVHLDLDKNLNIISGETGAGKSILLGALFLILGRRINHSHIKPGENFLEVSATFDIQNNRPLLSYLKHLDISYDLSNFTLKRLINRDENSKCYIHQKLTTLSHLKKISTYLIDIHSQNENQSLFEGNNHIFLLDQFAHQEEKIKKYQQHYKMYNDKKKILKNLIEEKDNTLQQKDYLLFKLKELQSLSITEEEYLETENKLKTLENDRKLSIYQTQLLTNLSSISSILDKSMTSIKQIDSLKQSQNETINTLYEIKEKSNDLYEYFLKESIPTVTDQDIDQLHEKLANADRLKKKYSKSISELHQIKNEIEQKISLLEYSDEDQNKLEKEVSLEKKQSLLLAQELHQTREQTAKELILKINQEIRSLLIETAEVSIEIAKIKDSHDIIELHKYGYTHIEFLYRGTPEHSFTSLQKIASGGEISRISLAIKTLLSKYLPQHCIIFDEIDTGIGGKTALVVGRKIATLAKERQIILITHLPQIAKYSQKHFKVIKESKTTTTTKIKELNPNEKERELSRMLFGDENEHNILKAKEFIGLP